MLAQMKVVDNDAGALVNAIKQDEKEKECSTERGKFKGKHAHVQSKECGNLGYMTSAKENSVHVPKMR